MTITANPNVTDDLTWLMDWAARSTFDQGVDYEITVNIETLDNPGWSITVGCLPPDFKFQEEKIDESEESWMQIIRTRDVPDSLTIACGAHNLLAAIARLRKLLEQAQLLQYSSKSP